jgi:hypothetical protein
MMLLGFVRLSFAAIEGAAIPFRSRPDYQE